MIEISPLTKNDFNDVSIFLNKHMDSAIPATQWMQLFTYPWKQKCWQNGVIAKDDNQIVGVWPCVHAEDSDGIVISNPSSFYILKEFRGQSIASKMVNLLLQQGKGQQILLSVSPHAEKIYQHWGFEPLEHYRYQFVKKNSYTTNNSLEISKTAAESCSPFLKNIAHDHLKMGCHCFWVENSEKPTLFVVKGFNSKSQKPYSELLYSNNYGLLESHGTELAEKLMRADDHYFNVDSRFFENTPSGFQLLELPAPRYCRTKTLKKRQIHLIYTEVPLLGIRP